MEKYNPRGAAAGQSGGTATADEHGYVHVHIRMYLGETRWRQAHIELCKNLKSVESIARSAEEDRFLLAANASAKICLLVLD